MKPILFYLSVFAFVGFMQSCLGARPSDEFDIQYGLSYTNDSDDSALLYDYMENETFDSFIKKFSADSLFQASRVTFPLRHIQQFSAAQKIEGWIEEKDWWRVIFEDSKESNLRYFNRRRKNDLPQGIVEITDLKTKLKTNYVFELDNGEWFLQEMVEEKNDSK